MRKRRRYQLVELHRPENGWGELQSISARARSAAEQVNSDKTPVRFLRSIFVPADDVCFHLFEGTATAAREVAVQAQLSVERVAEPLQIDTATLEGKTR
jgi:hypothetical protein